MCCTIPVRVFGKCLRVVSAQWLTVITLSSLAAYRCFLSERKGWRRLGLGTALRIHQPISLTVTPLTNSHSVDRRFNSSSVTELTVWHWLLGKHSVARGLLASSPSVDPPVPLTGWLTKIKTMLNNNYASSVPPAGISPLQHLAPEMPGAQRACVNCVANY